MAHPYLLQASRLQRPPVETALFDMFKAGPGPSSSHTIGPMKAGADFRRRCAALPDEVLARASAVHVTLLGSLSATGKGHGTDVAVLAGLLGHAPESCPPAVLPGLKAEPATRGRLCADTLHRAQCHGRGQSGQRRVAGHHEEDCQHLVSLDAAVMAMGEIGREMNVKFKETSEGGLAVSMVEC